ncbi:MAG: phosphoribosylformylglycinamidine synthase subunit PurQ [Saccharofermentanales bacterium]|jgi:phosphoribosylformylglycinamidine synthase
MEENKISTIFIEREPLYDVRLQAIKRELDTNLGIKAASGMRRFSRFEVQGLTIEEVWRVNYQVFSTLGLDYVVDPTELFDQDYILPLTPSHQKYDLKAASGLRLLKFYYPYRDLFVRSSEILVFTQPVSDSEKQLIQELLIDQANLSISKLRPVDNLVNVLQQPDRIPEITGFTELSVKELAGFKEKYKLKIDCEELQKFRKAFKKEKRNLLESELYLLDRIWSAENKNIKTDLGEVTFAHDLDPQIKASHDRFTAEFNNMSLSEYLEQIVNADDPDSLNWNFTLQIGTLTDRTEIGDPGTFAGLIKASMVKGEKPIKAMRLTTRSTLKIPVKSSRISQKQQTEILKNIKRINVLREQTKQVSLYTKKSDLSLSYVKEYYSDQFTAQGYEIAGLLTYKSPESADRQRLIPGDLVIILGSRTDLPENNTGSDAERNKLLQRFLLDPQTQTMLKQTSVPDQDGLVPAAAKLDQGIMLNLDVMPLAQGGLSGMDIAFSKTDDRVLAIVGVEHRHKFISTAQANDLEATVIGKINSDDRIIVNFRGQTIIDLPKMIFDFSQRTLNVNPKIELGILENKDAKKSSFAKNMKDKIKSPNVAVQRGLINNFAAYLGGNNILAQLGGKFASSPESGMITRIDPDYYPIDSQSTSNKVDRSKSKVTELYLLITHCYYPEIISQSPYHGAYQAVLNSYLKNITLGGNPKTVTLRLLIGMREPQQDQDWGNYYSALLGAYQAQKDFDLPLIKLQTEFLASDDNTIESGLRSDTAVNSVQKSVSENTAESVKNAKSNARKNLPLIIGFSLNTKNKKKFTTATLSEPDLQAYLVDSINNPQEKISKTKMKSVLSLLYSLINQDRIKHVLFSEQDITTEITKACFGEGLGFEFDAKLLNQDLLQDNYGRLIVFTDQDNAEILRRKISLTYLGKTTATGIIKRRNISLDLAELYSLSETGLSAIYPAEKPCAFLPGEEAEIQAGGNNSDMQSALGQEQSSRKKSRKKMPVPKVLIPEFESSVGVRLLQQVLMAAGAEAECFIFCSGLEEATKKSIRNFAEKINDADAIVLPGGYDLKDQPDGVAKFLSLILEQDPVKKSINELLARNGKILGIGNGFQALVACGLLPYGRYREWGDKQAYFAAYQEYFGNNRMVELEVVSNTGNWYPEENTAFLSPVIADYWHLDMPPGLWDFCIEHNLILTKFKTENQEFIDSLTCPEGKILGRLTHPEFTGSQIINRPQNRDSEFFERFVRKLKDKSI